jgi:hypothetical protein
MCFKYFGGTFRCGNADQFVACSVAEDEFSVGGGRGTTNLSIRVAVAEHPGHTSYV